MHLPFHDDPAKVFAGWSNDLYMCADKKLASARSTCCGLYSDRDLAVLEWADVLSEYRGERLTYEQNKVRCADWNRSICDPQRIGPFIQRTGQCLHRQSCADVGGSKTHITWSAYHWTNASCSVKVKVDRDGLIAIIHAPEEKWMKWNSENYPDTQSHVNDNKTVSYFHVYWNSTVVAAGKVPYPHIDENDCGGGSISGSGDFCICNTEIATNTVFDSLPIKDDVLSRLYIGAFDPTVMFPNEYNLVAGSNDQVAAFSKAGENDYSRHTIFRVKQENGQIFLKNAESIVKVCNTYSFRNPPTFFDLVDPQLISAYHETDAYLEYVDMHNNTPPFVCKLLMKHFGHSNPSPQHFWAVHRHISPARILG